jgi:hypothetical protein
MKTKSKVDVSNSPIPVAFRNEFNHFENISATQAWSLFFTASHQDTSLGKSLRVGIFWNILLVSIVVASILNILIFKFSLL